MHMLRAAAAAACLRLSDHYVRQAMLDGKRKDKTVVTLTLVPADDQILFVVAWKASGSDVKVEIAVNASDN
ncbi:hypothetical protein AK812_SmicGene47558, partial [Symbiodinium microadriaticum]